MKPWDRRTESVPSLAQAFFCNDPYYPRPRPQEPLHKEFKEAYKQPFDTNYQYLADTFLHEIEAVQADREAAVTQLSSSVC